MHRLERELDQPFEDNSGKALQEPFRSDTADRAKARVKAKATATRNHKFLFAEPFDLRSSYDP